MRGTWGVVRGLSLDLGLLRLRHCAVCAVYSNSIIGCCCCVIRASQRFKILALKYWFTALHSTQHSTRIHFTFTPPAPIIYCTSLCGIMRRVTVRVEVGVVLF